jgi:hypothetical protein
MPTDSTSCCLSVRQLAQRYGVGVHKVLAWITRGELAAINVANTITRPQWKILPQAIVDFENRRAAKPSSRVERRKKKVSSVIDFF